MRQGFKQTDIGVIPEDWRTIELGQLLEFKNGLNKSKEYFGSGTTIINYLDVFQYPHLDATQVTGLVEVERAEQLRYGVKDGDVLFTRTSETVDEIGLSTVVYNPPAGCVFSGFVLRGRFLGSTSQVSRHFLGWLLRSSSVRSQIAETASYTTRALTNGKLLGKVLIQIPSFGEQEAIAEVLSDVDAEISEAEKLLTKKIQLKTGLERYLLTDDGSWKKRRFSDLLTFEQPQKYLVEAAQISETGEIPVLTPGKTFILGYCSNDIDNLDSIECIVFDDFTTASKFVDFSFRLRSSAVKVLKAKDDVTHTRALEALLRKVRYKPEDHKRHWISQFQHFEVLVPDSSKLSEISLTIKDIDKEISSLEAFIHRSQAKKEGLMQTLLTGKIRLT